MKKTKRAEAAASQPVKKTMQGPAKSGPQSGPQSGPSIALALGGGGARGLAHILMLEVFDEFGIKPKVIAGTSVGAIFGAAYAAGLSAAEIRAHTELVLSQRFSLIRDLFQARAQPFSRLFGFLGQRSAILDPAAVLDIILPLRLPNDFASLEIPLAVVATDFYEQAPVVFERGDVRQAVAASIALPVVFQPVMFEGRALIDGGLCNPLPFDLLTDRADIVVAIDVSGVAPPPPSKREFPTAMEALFGSAFVFERTITSMKLKLHQPDIFIQAGTGRYQVLDFLKLNEILKAAEPAKERLKAQLGRVLETETLDALPDLSDVSLMAVPLASKQKRRRLPSIRRSRSISET